MAHQFDSELSIDAQDVLDAFLGDAEDTGLQMDDLRENLADGLRAAASKLRINPEDNSPLGALMTCQDKLFSIANELDPPNTNLAEIPSQYLDILAQKSSGKLKGLIAALNKMSDKYSAYGDDGASFVTAYAADLLEVLEKVAYSASDFICGTRFPQFAEDNGGLEVLMAEMSKQVAHFEHGFRPVPGVDVPGPDGDWGGIRELCNAEGVDVRIGEPLLKRAQEVWGFSNSAAPVPISFKDSEPTGDMYDDEMFIWCGKKNGPLWRWSYTADVHIDDEGWTHWLPCNTPVLPTRGEV